MSQIVNNLPSNPQNMPYDNFLLFYDSDRSIYKLVNFDDYEYGKFDFSGMIHCSGHGCIYDSYDLTKWTPVGSDYIDSYFPVDNIISSTVNIYNSDGSLHCSAVSRDYFTSSGTVSIISDTITPNTFLSVLNDTKMILPILVIALIAVIAFRKSWNFLKGAIRGA